MTTDQLPERRTAARRTLGSPGKRHKVRQGFEIWGGMWKHAIIIAVGVIMIYPLLWMVASSLRANDEIFSTVGLLVKQLRTQNYPDGWTGLGIQFGQYLANSAVIAAGAIIGNLLSCSMAAYAFARLEFRFKRAMFSVMLVTIMLPIHVVVVPQYIIFSQLGWVNTFLPLVVPKFLATDAFFVFLMVQFIRGIPRELDEAARLDGCGYFGIYFRIIMPLALPALATTAIFTFIWTWNDFFTQLIYLTNPRTYSVSVALRSFMDSTGSTAWGPLFAMSVVSILPVFVVFLVGQKLLVKGIATTGGK